MPKSMSLIVVVGGDHHVLRLQVAVHNAALVHVVESLADTQRDFDRALDGQLLLLVQNGPQQPALSPLHDHVSAAALLVVVGPHNAGVIEKLANLLFALEALEEHRVGFHLRQRHLDRHVMAVVVVERLVQHRHAAGGNLRFDQVVVEHFSGFKVSHGFWERSFATRFIRLFHGNS